MSEYQAHRVQRARSARSGTRTRDNAKVFDKQHFHDSFVSDPYDCDGIPAVDSGEVDVHFTAVQRGSSPFPAFREHFAGIVVTTNTDTGGTFTNVFALNNQDHKITDNNDDGTITITEDASGISRYYDQFGRFVLNDPGSLRFTFDLDYHGTPGDPDDDTEVPNSFRIVHGPTGNADFPTATSVPTYASSPPRNGLVHSKAAHRAWQCTGQRHERTRAVVHLAKVTRG